MSNSVVYLNNAGQAVLSPHVSEAGKKAIEALPWEQTNTGSHEQGIRELFATLIHADPTDIAITPSTAYAITLAARNVQRTLQQSNKSGRILLLQDQYDSAVYPWQQVCDESDGKLSLEVVGHPSTTGWTESVLKRIQDGVVAVCLPPIHWSDGSLIDLEPIGARCEDIQIPFIVDATQVVGAYPISVEKIRPTFLASSVHKWLRAPAGTSLVYVSKSVRKSWLPLDLHGRARDIGGGPHWYVTRNAMGPRGYPESFVHDARKFDSGGKPNPTLLPMLHASLEEVIKLDLEDVQVTLRALMDPLLEWATKKGFDIPSEPRGYHIVGIRPKERTPQELSEVVNRLQQQGIYLGVRCGGFRISPYIDTTPEDVQKLIEALEAEGF
eukprot:Nitzschia sp. Nitz4//scaffold166_size90379//15751//16965//NITZ4_005048-RA/size90379-snap-gene-0.54-mRNA-1//-1//CDS//3329538169//4245//frame0